MSEQSKQIQFPFPLKGVDRAWGYGNQPKATTPDCLNVRPRGTDEERARGGQRPGTELLYNQQIGAGNAVRMIEPLTTTRSVEGWGGTDETDFGELDGWHYSNGGMDWSGFWEVEVPWGHEPGRIWVRESDSDWDGENGNRLTMVRKSLDLSKTNVYTITLDAGYQEYYGGSTRNPVKAHIYARMDDSSPDPTQNGIQVTFLPGGEVRLHSWSGGTKDIDNQLLGSVSRSSSDELALEVDSDTITVYVNGAQVASEVLTSHSGLRAGFGIDNLSWSNSREYKNKACVFHWRVDGIKTSSLPYPKKTQLCVASNQSLWTEETPGNLVEQTSDCTLNTQFSLLGTPTNQALYIADFDSSATLTGEDGTIGGSSDNELDATSVSDWTTQGISADDDVVSIQSDSSDITDGVYEISSVNTSELVLATSAGGSGSCTYRITRCPKKYYPGGGLQKWVATSGSIPLGCQIITTYRGRIVLARSDIKPQAWFMSRSGDPLDWYYGATDAEAPVMGANSDVGQIGETINALIPYSDDYMLIGCESSLWVLRGDPMAGGVLDTISYSVGIIGRFAWCHGPAGEVYFLSEDGLHRIAPTGKGLKNISISRLPEQFRGFNHDTYEAHLAWNREQYGIHIFLTPRTIASDQRVTHWFYDLRNDAFWKDSLPGDYGPFATTDYTSAVADYRTMILGGRDGRLRSFSQAVDTDCGEAIPSHVVLGPATAGKGWAAHMKRLWIELATDSGAIDWELLKGDTAQEAAFEVDPPSGPGNIAASGSSWKVGRQQVLHQGVRSPWISVFLESTDTSSWAMEQVNAHITLAGRHK